MKLFGQLGVGRILATGYSRARHHFGAHHFGTQHFGAHDFGASSLTRRQRYLGLGAAAGLAALLLLGATLPAGAKGEFVIGAGGATVTIPQVKIKAGPVAFTGSAQQAMPRFVSNVGHFTIGQPQIQERQASNVVYGCPPYFSGGYGYNYGGLAYGGAGYGVPLYDYRAKGTYQRPRAAYGPGYHWGYARNDQRRLVVQPRARAAETLGTFNLPSGNQLGGYTEYGVVETPRPTFEPRIVQLAGTPQRSGPMPVVHKPAGKNHIHIE